MKKIEFIDITIESIMKGVQWAITFSLTYIILSAIMNAHITTLAENVCPLFVE